MRDTTAADRESLGDPVFAERYRQVIARDSRYDGLIVMGVEATGLFCNPSCPAPAARPSQIMFYPSAAAAHEAGLRPCSRCRPDAAPGSPEWNAHDDVAARAMRLIADGAVGRVGVPGIAARLGVTARHLLRSLTEHAGAGPLALARVARAHTARVLLTDTTLPMAQVSAAAGFASVRQFNESITALYGDTPSRIRQSGGHGRARERSESEGVALEVQLPVREPFDLVGLLGFLGDRTLAGMESGDESQYSRTVRLPHGHGHLSVRRGGAGRLACEVDVSDVRDVAPLLARTRRLFDLDSDPLAVDEALAGDPALAASVAGTPGIRVPGALDGEEILFRAMIGQQVSVAAARTVLGRLVAQLGEQTPWGALFPTSAVIAERGREVVRGPAKRVDAIIGAAEALASGRLSLHLGHSRSSLTSALTALPGIGPWTAGYVTMRVLGNPDVLLTGDLGIRAGAARLGLPNEPAPLSDHAREWAPWRSYAGMHLWRANRG